MLNFTHLMVKHLMIANKDLKIFLKFDILFLHDICICIIYTLAISPALRASSNFFRNKPFSKNCKW